MKEKPALPPVPSLSLIKGRLPEIFPKGVDARPYLVREIAAKTIFVMFYTGAIEGEDRWIRPDQVTKMTDAQAAKTRDAERLKWIRDSVAPGKMKDLKGRWYAPNTREPIRDETLRAGLVMTGAVIEREGLSTTSSKGRYALEKEFAALFDPKLTPDQLESKIAAWQAHLAPGSRARIALIKGRAAAAGKTDVFVDFPNGERRRMAPGPSSALSKAAIEGFAPAFLEHPAIVFLSESSRKVVAQDNELARRIGLRIEPDRNLPDIILADLGPTRPLLVFLEVVVTDGAITAARREALLAIAREGGFETDRVAFVSVFEDRAASVYRRLSSELAWDSFVWFASEPDCVLILRGPERRAKAKLSDLL
ncbi:MAG: restriction endonuclease [Acidobacteria bacterium]|nr:MAG: restriction endonuclease [Acidobacteriota bacterium]